MAKGCMKTISRDMVWIIGVRFVHYLSVCACVMSLVTGLLNVWESEICVNTSPHTTHYHTCNISCISSIYTLLESFLTRCNSCFTLLLSLLYSPVSYYRKLSLSLVSFTLPFSTPPSILFAKYQGDYNDWKTNSYRSVPSPFTLTSLHNLNNSNY